MERVIITSKEMGEMIRTRRRELGISQEKLAEMLGVSYQQVQRYENGNNKLNVENLQVIANFLSLPVTDFFKVHHRDAVAEASPSYMPAEEKNLLKHFRKILEKNDKLAVINVARLAAKKSAL